MRHEPAVRTWLLRLNHLSARALRRLRPYYVSIILLSVSLIRQAFPRLRGNVTALPGIPHQILVIRLDAIGDLVMSTLVFRELKRKFPAAKITAVIQNQGRSLIETNPFVDRIVSPRPVHKMRLLHRFRQDWAVLRMYLRDLRKDDFAIVLNPRAGGDLYSADVLIALVDCPQTFKYEDDSMKGLAQMVKNFAFRGANIVPRKIAQHEVVSNMAITERVTGQRCLTQPEIFLTDLDLKEASSLLAPLGSGITIVSVAFTAQAKKRAWPLRSWAEVLNKLSQDCRVFAILICAETEEPLGRELADALSVPSHLMSGASLRHVAAVLRQSDLFIGPDSGLAHTAAAMDCPAVVVSPHPLDGDPDHGNSPLRFGPYSPHSRIIQPLHATAPCIHGCDAMDPHCILQVEVDHVLSACREMLASRPECSRAEGEITPSAVSLQ